MFHARNALQTTYHGRMGQFFLGGWAVFARKIFRQRQKKTANLTWPKSLLSTTTSRNCLHS